MLSCKETSKLISRGLDQRLPRWQRFNLRLHLMMCRACSTYKHQIEALHQLFRKRFRDSHNGRESLSDEARQRMKQRLRDQSRNQS
jgi:hypothetical protein